MRADAQSAMVRVAIRDGAPIMDLERRAGGRGGYLHRDADCLDRFLKSKVREFKSLKCKLARADRECLVSAIRARLDRAASLEYNS